MSGTVRMVFSVGSTVDAEGDTGDPAVLPFGVTNNSSGVIVWTLASMIAGQVSDGISVATSLECSRMSMIALLDVLWRKSDMHSRWAMP